MVRPRRRASCRKVFPLGPLRLIDVGGDRAAKQQVDVRLECDQPEGKSKSPAIPR